MKLESEVVMNTKYVNQWNSFCRLSAGYILHYTEINYSFELGKVLVNILMESLSSFAHGAREK